METGGDPLDEAVALHEQALDLRGRHRRTQAEATARQSLELFERHAGPEDPDVANVANLLAGLRAGLRADDDDLAEAEALGRRAVAVMAALPAGDEDLDPAGCEAEAPLSYRSRVEVVGHAARPAKRWQSRRG